MGWRVGGRARFAKRTLEERADEKSLLCDATDELRVGRLDSSQARRGADSPPSRGHG